jgi:hypothetical protein
VRGGRGATRLRLETGGATRRLTDIGPMAPVGDGMVGGGTEVREAVPMGRERIRDGGAGHVAPG